MDTLLALLLPAPIEFGSVGITTCSGRFSSSLKLGSSILTEIPGDDDILWFEEVLGLGEFLFLRGANAGLIVAVTGFEFLLDFLIIVFLGCSVLLATLLVTCSAESI